MSVKRVGPVWPRRPARPARRWRFAIALGLALGLAAGARAEEPVSVDRCAGTGPSPVAFRADCEHVRAPQDKALCGAFLENQACKLFPVYRKITGFNLARDCPVITYHLYDKREWPHAGGSEGGFAGRCEMSLMTEFSVRLSSPLGPYDSHEMLHLYQAPLGALPQSHALFGPTQLEARRLIGDTAAFEQGFARLKTEFLGPEFEQRYASGRVKPADRCPLAEAAEEARLYVADTKNVYEFWRRLEPGRARDQADREARFNRMLDQVSKGTAREFLLAHGCAPF